MVTWLGLDVVVRPSRPPMYGVVVLGTAARGVSHLIISDVVERFVATCAETSPREGVAIVIHLPSHPTPVTPER